MANELKLQTDIKKSVIKDGGYAVKQTNQFTIGILDLKVCLPPFVPCDLEVKDIGEVNGPFNRLAGVSPKQAHTIRQMNGVYSENITMYTPSKRVAWTVVGLVHNGHHILIPAIRVKDAEGNQHWRVSSNYTFCAMRQVGGYYNMRPLLEGIGICQTRLM